MHFNKTAKYIPHVENEIGMQFFFTSWKALIYLKQSPFNQTTNKIVFHSGGTFVLIFLRSIITTPKTYTYPAPFLPDAPPESISGLPFPASLGTPQIPLKL